MGTRLWWILDFLLTFYRGVLTKSITKIHIAPTGICNSRCKTCFIWKNKSREDELSTEEWIDFFKKAPDSICWLSLSGGEPTLRPDLLAIIEGALKSLPNLKIISLTTNSLNPNKVKSVVENILSKNKKIRFYVTLSLDGIGKEHDFIRGIPKNYERLMTLYQQLETIKKKYKPRLIISVETTLSTFNYRKLKEILEHTKKHRMNHLLTIAAVNQYYHNIDDEKIALPTKKLIPLLKKYYEWMGAPKNPFHLLKKTFVKNAITYAKNPRRHPIPCASTSNGVYIAANGDVHPCITWYKKLGNIKETTLNDIMGKNISKQIIKEIKKEKCPGCWTPCEATQTMLKRPWNFLFP